MSLFLFVAITEAHLNTDICALVVYIDIQAIYITYKFELHSDSQG